MIHNETGFGRIVISPRSLNSVLFLVCMYFMIIMTVFNGNKYLAGLSFVWLPSFLLLGASLVMKKKIITRLNLYTLLLGISAAISTSMATVDISQSTHINLQFCIISFILIASVILTDNDFSAFFKFYMGFCFIICLVLIFNYLFSIGVQTFSAGNVRVTIQYFGIVKDVNYLSAFVLPCFAYNLYVGCFAKKKWGLVRAGITFIAMFIAGSRACFLAMLISGTLIVLKMVFDRNHKINKPLVIVVLIIAGIALYAVVSRSAIFERTTNFENYTSNSRITIWTYALNGFFAHPIIGSGVESGSYYSLLGTRWKTHNCFIDILVGQGIIGGIIIIAMFIYILKVSKQNRVFLSAIMICFFVPLFFVNGYECATFWMPMTISKYISDKCRDHEDILQLLV